MKCVKCIIKMLNNILQTINNGWKIRDHKAQNIVICRGKKSFCVDISDVKLWSNPFIQHIQFWAGGNDNLFLCYAKVDLCNKTTFRNIKRAFKYAMNFINRPSSYQMAKITCDSVKIGCCYDNVIFEGPFLKTNGACFFNVHRTLKVYNLFLQVQFSICKTCSPNYKIEFKIPPKQSKSYTCENVASLVDKCIDEVVNHVFLLPEYRPCQKVT